MAALLLWTACAQTSEARPEPSLEADRLPWSPSAAPFLRSYLGLGPLSPKTLTEPVLKRIAQTPATPGANEQLGDDASAIWQYGSSWSDTIELGSLFSKRADARDTGADLALARFTVSTASEGEAELSVGANFAFALWVNGVPHGDFPAPEAFLPDLLRIPVALRQGDNDILLRIARPLAAPRLSLRAIEAGATPSSSPRVASSIDWNALPELVIRSAALDRAATAIRYEVRAPGGEIVARADTTAGDPVRIETAAWKDGPYEIACLHQDAWGRQQTALLSWYKGDAAAAARRAIESQPPSASESRALVYDMLRELMQQRLHELGNASPVASIEALHSPLFEWLERAPLDASPSLSTSLYRLAWIDPADGSPQFCRAYLPLNYDPRRQWPVVVQLHGFNPANPPYIQWWSIDQRHSALADRHGAIILEPHGRGNAQYVGIGEADVMRALNKARKRFSIDDRRIYLTGESMGGSGTWLIGSRHTDTFAAIAPVYGGWDYRVVAPDGVDPAWRAETPAQAFQLDSRSSFRHLESLVNTPVYALHGDADAVVSPDHTRHAVRLLQRWGYPIRYREAPGGAHDDLGARDEIFAWLLGHQLNEAPAKVRVRSTDLSGAASSWLRIEGYEQSARVIAADAEALNPGRIRLDTSNVTRLELSPPPSLLGDGPTVRINWNGRSIEAPSSPLPIRLSKEGGDSAGVFKKPDVEGPISDIIRSPFAVVVGTASEVPEIRQLLRKKGDAFSELWTAWQGSAPRVFLDTEVTPEIERSYSLLLLGGPKSNAVSRRMADALPFTIDGDAVTIGSQRFDAPDAVVESIWPHPQNPDRYIVLVDATSADGFYFWNPLLWNVPFGFPSSHWDWRIIDGRLDELDHPLEAQQAWVASGAFDGAWRIDASTTWRGDDQARRESVLRKAPPSGGFALTDSQLDAVCGRYEITPWLSAVVSRRGRDLQLSIADAPPETLIAETESRFAFATTASPIVFEKDSTGKVASLTLYNEGVPTRAEKR